MVKLNSKTLLSAALVAQSVVGEACNPMTSTNCPADTALSGSFSEDFHTESKWFKSIGNPGNITYGSDGLTLTLEKRLDNPSLHSTFYIMYGKVEAIAQAAPGQGMISSVFLQSDDLDEIDIEWTGGDTTQVQSNYFSKGQTTTYDRGEFHPVDSPQTTYHNYTVDWTKDAVTWYIDGVSVRVLPSDAPEGFPESPMALNIGIWAGGDSGNAPGTIEWAGGLTDYSQAPFSMGVKQIIVTDYSSGSEYTYGDQSGSADSIKAKDGSVNGRYDQAQVEFAALVDGQSVSEPSVSANQSSTISAVSSTVSVASSTSSVVVSSSSATNTTSTSTSTSSKKTSTSTSTTKTAAPTTTTTSSAKPTTTSKSSTKPTTTEAPKPSTTSTAPSSSTLVTKEHVSSTASSSATVQIAQSNGASKSFASWTMLFTLIISLF
ncbi:hypothetical protein NCAS_0A07100 [Naumovozyma castellii]|uniref:Crh-like protein n=1 Tax=Naumovozyma castellii TaxID=27288 RepID=G0V720_NAUCA|nr:hypothetical protein NCAS_0A07100 [Naumovozyma castellii CBS 4309]CCC67268.1 hypothetical protein NCAS_0A07100 [Naumovozyma castellii CBS 4309]